MTEQQTPPLETLVKGNAYFIVLNEGDVYQGEYRGYHRETGCYWFAPLMFANSVNGPQWVFFRRIRTIFDLGTPFSGSEFNRKIEGLLE